MTSIFHHCGHHAAPSVNPDFYYVSQHEGYIWLYLAGSLDTDRPLRGPLLVAH